MSKIKYRIAERMIGGVTRFFARVVYSRDLDTNEFLGNVIGMGSTLTMGDLKAAVEMINTGIQTEINRGNRVRLPWGVYYPSIRGSMEHAEGQYLSGRNKFVAKVTIPKAYTKSLSENGVPVKIHGGDKNPVLKRLLDQVYDVANLVLTSNSVASLKGKDLKFSKNDKRQGVFLIDENGMATRSPFYADITDQRVLFVVPQLEQGKLYKVCLKTLDPETGDLVVKSLKHQLTADIVPDPDMPEPEDEEEQASPEGSSEQETVLREDSSSVDEVVADGGVQVEQAHIPVSDSSEVGSSTMDDVVDSSDAEVDTGQGDSEIEYEEDPDDDVDEDPGSDE